jgi:hypothetical protein
VPGARAHSVHCDSEIHVPTTRQQHTVTMRLKWQSTRRRPRPLSARPGARRPGARPAGHHSVASTSGIMINCHCQTMAVPVALGLLLARHPLGFPAQVAAQRPSDVTKLVTKGAAPSTSRAAGAAAAVAPR